MAKKITQFFGWGSDDYQLEGACYRYVDDLPNITVDYKGVAFIVSNDYKTCRQLESLPYAHVDSKRMAHFFTHLKNYIVVHRSNLSKRTFMSTCKYLAVEFPGGYTRVVVYFAGHGLNGVVMMQDGKKVLLKDIRAMFNPNHVLKMKDVVKIFFIDACRGTLSDPGIRGGGQSDTKNRSLPLASQGKELVAYATTEDFVAFDSSSGGIWTSHLYKELRDSKGKSIVDVLRLVLGKMNHSPVNKKDGQSFLQTSDISLRLAYDEDVKFLDEAGS